MQQSKNIAFIGNYTDLRICENRGLRFPNPAGTNRIKRLSKALLSTGHRVYIIAPGSSARIKFNHKFYLKKQVLRSEGIILIYPSALAIPYLSSFFELIIVPMTFLGLNTKYRFRSVLMYCYYPSTILTGWLAKILKIQIIEDLEDIVSPRISDLITKPITFTIQQILGLILMKISIKISDLIITPSTTFIKKLNFKKRSLVINGCMDISKCFEHPNQKQIQILLSGTLDKEQGIDLYLDALTLINQNKNLSKKYKFCITGISSNEAKLRKRLENLDNLEIKYFGFVENNRFSEILNQSHICLILQDPTGRYSMHKTPSKGYEYMASGKTIIVSSIGDYPFLPKNTHILLEEYTATCLVEILSDLDIKTVGQISKNAFLHAQENWSFEIVGDKILKFLE